MALNRLMLLAEEIVDDFETRARYPPDDPRARSGPVASHRPRRGGGRAGGGHRPPPVDAGETVFGRPSPPVRARRAPVTPRP
ncbi:hypothetical protein [Streptomyces sp. ST2-7A]|uniref:hypothetical protein n=1 Tax=Streptomyces sp. ST2-7A TaxID=2907214 RepID=UPI001F247130|nr:hypothetical protein [Streptomyces sp. ST2-7A]MCE7079876.1 hypothetical protein [Streptomyces sp. ST2-7A]